MDADEIIAKILFGLIKVACSFHRGFGSAIIR